MGGACTARQDLRLHAVEVMRVLGPGYREAVYHRAMITALNNAGIRHRSEVLTPIYFQREVVGIGRCDLVIGNMVVEIKANANPPHRSLHQLKKYTSNLSRGEKRRYRGLIINFNQRSGKVQTLALPVGRRRKGPTRD